MTSIIIPKISILFSQGSSNRYCIFNIIHYIKSMSLKLSELEKLIKDAMPDASVKIQDLAGDENHYSATIESKVFKGMSKIEQHKFVYKALKGKMGNELHALALNTIER